MFSSVFNNYRSRGDQTSDLVDIINYVFLPAHLPEDEDREDCDPGELMQRFARAVCATIDAYYDYIDDVHKLRWNRIVQVLRGLCRSDEEHLFQLHGMQPGDSCIIPSLGHESAIILRKQDHCTLYEPFELNPVRVGEGAPMEKVIHSYPELTIEIPDEVFHDAQFQSEFANFLRSINSRSSDSYLDWCKTFTGFHPRYTIQLLSGILRVVGRLPEVTQIVKHVIHRVHERPRTRHRSQTWFLIKVAVQSSLDRSSLGRAAYKTFMLFFMLNLANHAAHTCLSSDLLHLMSTKILRRFRKLGTSVPKWLSDAVMQTCTCLSETLYNRCIQAQIVQPAFPSWNPLQLDLTRDIQLSLPHSSEYLSGSLPTHDPNTLDTPVLHHPVRGSLRTFLSSNGRFFETAYHQDPRVALYDVEQVVEQEIDDWNACVMDVDEACIQLDILVEQYLSGVQAISDISDERFRGPSCGPEHFSIALLTVIELWIALDKLVIKKVPILIDYSPEIPMNLLDRVLLRKTTNLHRFIRAHQYLSARHAQSQPGLSVFSQKLTEHSFPIRCATFPHFPYPTAETHSEIYSLSTSPLYAKVVRFELQCPVSFEAWRTTTIRFMDFCDDWKLFKSDHGGDPKGLPIVEDLRRRHYTVRHRRTLIKPAHHHDQSLWVIFDGNVPRRQVVLPGPNLRKLESLAYEIPSGPYADLHLQKCLTATTHTSNEVLSVQASCHVDLSLHEFIAFGLLRSGGSLQWMNILCEVRNRSLNFRRHEIHLLLSQAMAQVGPFSSTGELIWHRELQNASFCYRLLDELESLFVDIGAGSSDGPVMGTISILASLLASGPSGAISERTLQLLRKVREKTFSWVSELLYDMIKSPTNEERRRVLWNMAAICRGTFDVDPAIMHKLLHSARDIEIALACAILMRTIISANFPNSASFSQELLERDCRLSHALEGTLKNAIQADIPDLGVDLAVRKRWPGYRPGIRRWEPLDCQNSSWLTCQTKETRDQRSQIVHVNLLDGSLLVDGRPLGERLPSAIMNHPVYRVIFGDLNFEVIPSDFPGMDFVTVFMISEHHVLFSLRSTNLVIRARHKDAEDIFELIPQEQLQGDLPGILVEGHAHWLNLSTHIIEIRPLEKLWEKSFDNWMINHASRPYQVTRGREFLVDIRSPTWEMVSRRLECLDTPDNLVITSSPVDKAYSPSQRLSVTLPRYDLSFFVNDGGDLESRDFTDMVYDEDQCVGTLFGLVNKLVLRPKAQIEEDLFSKCMLVPDGILCLEQHVHQPRIMIKSLQDARTVKGSRRPDNVPYHIYKIDDTLGCLTGSSSLRSRLYLAELHALTNNACRPDPLTGRTGVEEAISLTWLTGTRLTLGCRGEDRIHNLVSSRRPHVPWFPGPQLPLGDETSWYVWSSSQGPQTQIAMKKIYQGTAFDATLKKRQDNVLQEAYLYASEVVSHWQLPDKADHVHILPSLEDYLVWFAASTTDWWSRKAPIMNDLSSWAKAWGDTIVGDDPLLQLEALEQNGTVPQFRIDIYNLLGRGGGKGKGAARRFQLLFAIPTLVYSSKDHDNTLLSTLEAFANQPRIHLENPPSHIQVGLGSEDNLPQRLSDWYHSLVLKNSITHTDSEGEPTSNSLHPNPESAPYTPEPSSDWQIALDQLLRERPEPKLPSCHRLPHRRAGPNGVSPSDISRLGQVFSSLLTGETAPEFQTQYVSRLQASTRDVRIEETCAGFCGESAVKPSTKILREHYVQCKASYTKGLGAVKKALGPRTQMEQILDRCGQWPRATPYTLFRCLASTSPIKPPENWEKCLISFALLALELQRARRLLQFALENLEEEFSKELENEGGDGWIAAQHADWLLIQLQGNFLIRRGQVDVAKEMMAPRSKENTVMQVNMGEGKSSVIIPICAAALANGSQLVRVIVPKALKTQMLQLLANRLGGLVGMSIYQLTLSRFRSHSYIDVDVIRKIVNERGILVMTPEDVLALKLVCVDKMVDTNIKVDSSSVLWKSDYEHLLTERWLKSLTENTYVAAVFLGVKNWLHTSPEKRTSGSDDAAEVFWGVKRWLRTSPEKHTRVDEVDAIIAQKFQPQLQHKEAAQIKELQSYFYSHARDILDESDEILQPRFQMIYTLGLPQHVEGFPGRWAITQQVLRLVNRHASFLSTLEPREIECERSAFGSFPRMHILQVDSEKRFIPLIAGDVVRGRLVNLGIQYLPRELRDAIYNFISHKDILPETARTVEEYARENTSWGTLLLLRGLLADNILLFALTERRWRVDYGLDSTRTMLAIPYRAKDVPSARAEFGHPDLTIVLTCLSYYYGGLSEEQLRTSFEILLEQDDPSSDYAIWLEDCASGTVPDHFRNLSAINIRSSEQWEQHLVPLFSRNQGAVDFYLSRVVFPKYAKEYPWKISGSSWDIAERKNHLVTGFSGTNDAQYLLPTSIRQDDPDHLHQTGSNASVLANLLHPDNDHYIVTAYENGERWTTLELLRMVVAEEPEIRVLLDVGAQILDLSNHALAKTWLDLAPAPHTAGAIYFDENDELVVLTRNGTVQPLLSSPLVQQLDRCIAYLDDVHTRGTDIKFPRGFRAAVTLGAKVTKDRLAQGCMRMRKLGHGHSVMFFVPFEVDRRIRSLVSKHSEPITTTDILHWVIQETWSDIRRWAPHWAQQGITHKSQHETLSRFLRDELTPDPLATSWLQPEIKSLADLYAPRHHLKTTLSVELDLGIRQRCKSLGVSSLPDARLDEEQEREVSREIERERETVRPHKAEPAEHSLHPDVVEFVRNGVLHLQPHSTAFRPIFTTLTNSSAATGEPRVWSPYILATTDFCNVIIEDGSFQGRVDDYLRPVRWILSGKRDGNDVLVILSPFEADRLMPYIRLSEHVHLHLYTPRTTERMKPSDDLKWYTIPAVPDDWTPPWALIDQLNVFAGQLYLGDYTSYVRLCHFLGVHTEDLPLGNDGNATIQRNWFNFPGSLEPEIEITFDETPLPFVMMLLAIRRRGMDFSKTHMGNILRGQLLTEKDFQAPALPIIHYGLSTVTE
ncbi:hypothetical protein OG21DRAFT_1514065 [Imleria badia]|nr:hypothetical protein OG21DRAFT_1514065 [Imleria badia]